MGVNIIVRAADRSEAELVTREDLCNRSGVMHGSAVMGIAGIMGGMTASAALPGDTRINPEPGSRVCCGAGSI